MARGWESKSVEEQIELAAEKAASLKSAKKIDEAEAARLRELESLQLSRTRVLTDIAASNNPKYKEMLQRSLEFLDEKLAQVTATQTDTPSV
jgi:phage terminase Nu1 subunit (DNA packaging protein)